MSREIVCLWKMCSPYGFGAVLLVLLLAVALAKNNYQVQVHSFKCLIGNAKAVNELTCTLQKERGIPLISVRFSLNETVESFNIKLIFNLIKKDNSRLKIADVLMDGCKYLTSFYDYNFFGRFYKRIKAVGILPKACPIQGMGKWATFLFETKS